MNRTRLLMIGVVALALGTFVSLFVYKNLQGKSSSSGETRRRRTGGPPMTFRSVARIEEHDVHTVKYPASSLPAGTYSARSKVMGRGVILPISKASSSSPASSRRKMPAPVCPPSFPRNARRFGAR